MHCLASKASIGWGGIFSSHLGIQPELEAMLYNYYGGDQSACVSQRRAWDPGLHGLRVTRKPPTVQEVVAHIPGS